VVNSNAANATDLALRGNDFLAQVRSTGRDSGKLVWCKVSAHPRSNPSVNFLRSISLKTYSMFNTRTANLVCLTADGKPRSFLLCDALGADGRDSDTSTIGHLLRPA